MPSAIDRELRQAIEDMDLAGVEAALTQGANVDADLSNKGLTSSTFGAVLYGDKDVLGYRALHFAVRATAYDIAKYLLSQGANPNLGNDIKNTPLHLAIYTNQPKLARLLLENGANIDQVNANCTWPTRSEASTPLHYAVLYTDEPMVELLLSFKPQLNIKDAKGLTAYELSEKLNRPALALLIEQYVQQFKQAQLAIYRDTFKQWLERDTNFKTLYQTVWTYDYVHYARYTHFYENYSIIYDLLLEGQTALAKDSWQMQQDEAKVTGSLNKLAQAQQQCLATQTQLRKQQQFIQEQLYQTNSSRNERLQKAMQVFAKREEAELMVYLDTPGLKQKLTTVEQQLVQLETAAQVLTKQQAFYQELKQRITDSLNFDKLVEQYQETIHTQPELVLELKSQFSIVATELTNTQQPKTLSLDQNDMRAASNKIDETRAVNHRALYNQSAHEGSTARHVTASQAQTSIFRSASQASIIEPEPVKIDDAKQLSIMENHVKDLENLLAEGRLTLEGQRELDELKRRLRDMYLNQEKNRQINEARPITENASGDLDIDKYLHKFM